MKFNKCFEAKDFLETKEITLDKGEVFLYEGDASHKNAYLIVSGVLDIRLISGTGHETLLFQLETGELIGELAMFGAQVRTATIVATSKVVLLEIPDEEFSRQLQNNAFLEKLASHFLRRYLKTHEVVNRLSQPNIGMKLCYYFKTLASQVIDGQEKQEVSIQLPSHAVLAKLLSCQRESVTRELKKLTQAHVLKQVKGSHYLLNMRSVNLYLGDLLEVIDGY